MLTRTEANKLIGESEAFVTTTVETVVRIDAKLVALMNVPIQALIHSSWKALQVYYLCNNYVNGQSNYSKFDRLYLLCLHDITMS